MGNGGATGGTPGSGDAPVILTLSPNVTTLTPNDLLVVTAARDVRRILVLVRELRVLRIAARRESERA